MHSESSKLSVPSIAEHVGQDGSFIVETFHFKKNKKTILLAAQGSTDNTDMQKVEILPPADFQVKISAKGQNQTLLLGFMNFRQFS